MPDDPKDRNRDTLTIGAAIAIGAGVGTALFAGSDNPIWIGLGAGMGAAVGAALQARRR